MRIVTGGAGFIGSNLVRGLNARGDADIIVVDRVPADELRNLADCRIANYMESRDFLRALAADLIPRNIEAIFHQGACADTTQTDERLMMETNFEFSRRLLDFAIRRAVPMVYASSASVYGAARESAETIANENPLNLYARSKLAFDNHVRSILPMAASTIVGIRYFNVYGPREAHKGRMASMAYQLYRQLKSSGVARLFAGTDGFGDGEQRRDFVFVGDVVSANLFFAERPVRKGIFNFGTGHSRGFNDVARALIALLGHGRIEYIPFPAALSGKYQSFTQADLRALRASGYAVDFTTLEEGIAKALTEWERESQS